MTFFRNRIARNILSNQMGFAVSVIVTFFLSPFVVTQLGDFKYGIWSLIISLSGHYGLLSFGMQRAVTRYITHAVVENDHERASSYMSSAFFCFLMTSLGCVMVGLIVSLGFERILGIGSARIADAGMTFFVVSLTAASGFFFAIFNCNLFAHQHFLLMNAIGILDSLMRAGLTVFILISGHGLLALSLMGLGLSLVTGVIQVAASTHFCGRVRVRLAKISKPILKELLTFGSKSFLIVIATTLIYECDLLVIGVFLTPERISIYSLAGTLVIYLNQFVLTVNKALSPHAVTCYARQGVDGVAEFTHRYGYLMYMLGGTMLAGCLVLGRDFFSLWIGDGYTESGIILGLLLIPQFFKTGFGVFGLGMSAMDKIGWLSLYSVAEGVANLILSVILVQHFGIYGVAAGTLISAFMNQGIFSLYRAGGLLSLGLRDICMRFLCPGLVLGLIGSGAGLAVKSYLPPEDWATFVLNVLAILLACGMVAAAFLGMNRKFLLKSDLGGHDRR